MTDQPSAASLAPFGRPASLIEAIETAPLEETLSQEAISRLHSAQSSQFYVFPRSASLYRVESVTDGRVKSVYTVNVRSQHACNCSDYVHRRADNHFACKHIWRVRLLIKLDALPAVEEDPYAWLINELHKDKQWLQNTTTDATESIAKLNRLEKRTTRGQRGQIDYRTIFRKRARALIGKSPPIE